MKEAPLIRNNLAILHYILLKCLVSLSFQIIHQGLEQKESHDP
jgi:hypothetical protein